MFQVITAPSSEPVTLTEAKEHLRVDGSLEDAYITSLIKAARSHAENYCGITLFTTSYKQIDNSFPGTRDNYTIQLFRPVIQADPVVKYYDSDNELQTVLAADYSVDYLNGKLYNADGWPTTYDRLNAVEITYDAGYTTVDKIPIDIVHAVKLLIASMYEQREDRKQTFTTAAQALLRPYKIFKI